MKCPGQDSRYWKEGAIFETKCPKCNHNVEFFKDDTTRRCAHCGHRLTNPNMDFGCATYCRFADQCLGTLPPELLAQKEDLFKDRVAIEMKRYFKRDFKRIGHATRVARYAERIGKKERGNLAVILTAAYLHDIGIPESEIKYGSSAAKYQEKEGPPIARSILITLGAKEALIDEVCDIIAHHHHPKTDETINFKVLYDADLITNIEENCKENPLDAYKLNKMIENRFLTGGGREEARKVLIQNN
jgi:hypothetical protein